MGDWGEKAVKNSLIRGRSWWRRTEGMVAVEFAILGTVFLLFIGGIIDFGHGWYMKQVITNASREGARYGVAFRVTSSAVRIKPSEVSPSISAYLLTDTNGPRIPLYLPADASPTVSVAGTGLASGIKGDPLEVTVTAVKHWWMVSTFIPGMTSTTTLSATTVMQLE